MRVKIEKVDNGFILTDYERLDDGKYLEHKQIFQDDNMDENGELHATLCLFYALMDELDVDNNKHRKVRLVMDLQDQWGEEELGREPRTVADMTDEEIRETNDMED